MKEMIENLRKEDIMGSIKPSMEYKAGIYLVCGLGSSFISGFCLLELLKEAPKHYAVGMVIFGFVAMYFYLLEIANHIIREIKKS